ncbi:MAG: DUF371 domain-containing protein [Candidatus Bathyarchaeota archaeon]|nr:DUF371 domain-containing protein [Candidatus Bathyarchaeota archaeon]
MRHTFQFKAKGHPNIRSRHKTTLMTTIEPHLTPRGDCIIAVGAEIGLAQLPEEIKQAARNPETRITFTLQAGNQVFETTGIGDPELEYTDKIDMVARKSSYTCGRTLMIQCDKAAIDIPDELVEVLKDPETMIMVQLTYESP